jgi:hypothetical protein
VELRNEETCRENAGKSYEKTGSGTRCGLVEALLARNAGLFGCRAAGVAMLASWLVGARRAAARQIAKQNTSERISQDASR